MQNLNTNQSLQEQQRLKDKPLVGSTSTSTTSTFGNTTAPTNVIKDEIIATNVRTVQENLGSLQQQQLPFSSSSGLGQQQFGTPTVQSGTFASTMSSFSSDRPLTSQPLSSQFQSNLPSQQPFMSSQPLSSQPLSSFSSDRPLSSQPLSNQFQSNIPSQQPLLGSQPTSSYMAQQPSSTTFISGSQPQYGQQKFQQMGTGYQSFGTGSFQQWPLGTFYIRSKMNGYVLDAKDVAKAGSAVSAYPLHFAPNQQFRFEQGGIIRNISSGLVLDIACSLGDRFKGGIHGKNSVFMDNYDGATSQVWQWDGIHLINMHDNKVLDIKGESDKAGATLIVYDMKTTGDLFNQQWELLPI